MLFEKFKKKNYENYIYIIDNNIHLYVYIIFSIRSSEVIEEAFKSLNFKISKKKILFLNNQSRKFLFRRA